MSISTLSQFLIRSIVTLAILLFSFSIFGQSSTAATVSNNCKLYLDMVDSAGDGWGSGFVFVRVDGVGLPLFGLRTEAETKSFDIKEGSYVEVFYSAGGHNTENSYRIRNAVGEVVFQDGSFFTEKTEPTEGINRVFKVTCPESCSGRENYTVSVDLGDYTNEMGWVLKDEVGNVIERADVGDYSSFSKGMNLSIPVRLENCKKYEFETLGNWSAAKWSIIASDSLRGSIITEGQFANKGFVLSSDKNESLFLPCHINATDWNFRLTRNHTACHQELITIPNQYIPIPEYCEGGNAEELPEIKMSIPNAIIPVNNVSVHTPIALPIGESTIFYEITYSDGQKLRASSKVIVESAPVVYFECKSNLSFNLSSFNDLCTKPLGLIDVLENNSDNICEDEYNVSIFDENGNNIGTQMTTELVGQQLTYKVTNIANDLLCEGNIVINNDVAPSFEVYDYHLDCTVEDILNENLSSIDTFVGRLQTENNNASNSVFAFDVDCIQEGLKIEDIKIEIEANASVEQFILVSPSGETYNFNNIPLGNEIQLSFKNVFKNSPETLNTQINHFAASKTGAWEIVFENTNQGSVNINTATIIFSSRLVNYAIDGGCSSFSVVLSSEEIDSTLCGSESGTVINRVWTAIDPEGNELSKKQLVIIDRLALTDLNFPNDLILSCGESIDVEHTGVPSYSCRAISTSNFSSCRLVISYVDSEIQTEDGGYFIEREWTIFDLCTSQQVNYNQNLIFVDDTPPVLPTNQVDIFDMNQNCLAKANLFDLFKDECGEIDSIIVDYQIERIDENLHDKHIVLKNGQVLDSLSIGMNEISVKVVDKEGNTAVGNILLNVIDNIEPVVSLKNISIKIGKDGNAVITPTMLNEGSSDNCQIATMQIKRLENECDDTFLNFSPFIKVTCCDIDKDIDVEVRVVDASGNENIENATVSVQKLASADLNCPIDITIQCGEDIDLNNLARFGTLTAASGCDITYKEEIVDERNSCGVGVVYRKFFVAKEEMCQQVISIVDNNKLTIKFPNDTLLASCNADISQLPEPIAINDGCIVPGISYEDRYEESEGEECKRIVRTWKVVHFCQSIGFINESNYGGKQIAHNTYEDDGDGYFQIEQIIRFQDDIAPEISPLNDTLIVFDGDCESDIVLTPILATDNCKENILAYPFPSEFTLNVGDTVRVAYEAIDDCGNISIQVRDVIGKSTALPRPVCVGDLAWKIEGESVEIKPIDLLNLKATFSSCYANNELNYSFSEDLSDTIATYTCEDEGVQVLQVFVTTPSGNQNYCTVEFKIKSCKPSYQIAGTVSSMGGVLMSDIDVELQSDDLMRTITGIEGEYRFEDLPEGDYNLNINIGGNIAKGLTTLDLILIRQHLLGLKTFTDKESILAADVNGTGTISVADVLLVRDAILGKIDSFPRMNLWKTINKKVMLESTADDVLLNYKNEPLSIQNLENDLLDWDVLAIKTGDVNGTNLKKRAGSRSVSTIQVSEVFEDGKYRYSFDFSSLEKMIGFQFSLSGVPSDIDLHSNVLDESHYLLENNKLLISWAEESIQNVSSDSESMLFSIISNQQLNDLSISNEIEAEIYSKSVDDISITNAILKPVASNFVQMDKELTVYPNPFYSEVFVQSNSPINAYELKLYNINGEKIREQKYLNKTAQLTLELAGLQALTQGVYFIEILTPEGVFVRKLIKD